VPFVKKFVLLCTTALLPSAIYAQSTGTVATEEHEIVVTGKKQRPIAGVELPDTSKAKVVVTQEAIAKAVPGQTVLDTINLVPGVSFQNNDPYGSAGGTLTIRGFDSSRISLTFDGIPLNDTGNYAIYSNQMLDPELVQQVNVNLGSTDVDSPTASAVGGTVNLREIVPTEQPSVRVVGSLGSLNFRRIFGLVNTGAIGPWGTRIFVAASTAKNDVPFNGYGKVDKQQYNARIWQPIGSNGDFVSVAAHYNQNRNNFFGSVDLENDALPPNGFPQNRADRDYKINAPCTLAPANPGVADFPNSCGTEFDRRFNPSNTGNIRGESRFTLGDGLVLTVDPSYQYVKANGGGTISGFESTKTVNGVVYTGYLGGSYYFGHDLNGDSDTLDKVTLLAPSHTQTHRYGVIADLRWDINPSNTVRVGYTLDYGRHRQTGEVGYMQQNGSPVDVFPVNDPILDSNGYPVEKRDRLSYAILNQVSGEYRGIFGPVTVNVGVRVPFFERKLDNYCFTTSASGFVDCFGQNATLNAAYEAAHPYSYDPTTHKVTGYSPPQKRDLKYNKLLPNIGAVYDATREISLFANYAKGLSVPGTDSLYNSFYFPLDTEEAKPKPETTDSFDGGVRYHNAQLQAQLSGWYTKFHNRLASAYDPVLDTTVYRNLGNVDKWGIDGSVGYSPMPALSLYVFGSWMRSKIHDNIQIGSFGGITDCSNIPSTATIVDITRSCALTEGKFESGVPKYSYGASVTGRAAGFEVNLSAKRTGPRYVYDNNLPVYARQPIGTASIVYPASTPAYWLVNLEARYDLTRVLPQMNGTYLQLNVYNLLDSVYVGGFGGGLNQSLSGTNYSYPPFVQIGAPRAIVGSISLGFGGGAVPLPPRPVQVPPPPPPAPPATQTCADGSVILATDTCPVAPPPPPPAPTPERGF
jgi:iron complex outermembrane receptor protein